MNGKLAPSSAVCKNLPDSSESDVTFYYGYRYQARPDMSRYALRERARNLSLNPYTDGEEQCKAMFTQCVATAKTMLADSAIRLNIIRAFGQQRRYCRLWNYTVAELVSHNGQRPPEWR